MVILEVQVLCYEMAASTISVDLPESETLGQDHLNAHDGPHFP